MADWRDSAQLSLACKTRRGRDASASVHISAVRALFAGHERRQARPLVNSRGGPGAPYPPRCLPAVLASTLWLTARGERERVLRLSRPPARSL